MKYLLVVITLLFVTSCARKSNEPDKFVVGTVLSAQEIRKNDIFLTSRETTVLFKVEDTIFGKLNYAPVTEEWLKWNHEQFISKINDSLLWGVTGWNNSATCTWYTSRFIDEVQQAYFRRAFNSEIGQKAVSPALAEFWYHPGGNMLDGKPHHAIVECFTENGRRFFEPQTGRFVTLTLSEIDSARYLVRKFN